MAIAELDALKELDFSKQLTFAYLTCERLYPNYVFFSITYNFGKPYVLREAIDFLYDNLLKNNPDESKIDTLLKKVEKNTPDPGDFDTGLASSGLDSCGVIYESLSFLLDRKIERLSSISTMAIDTVHMYIHDVENLDFNNDKNFWKKINDHPLMKKEIAIQQGIIAFLSKSETIDYGDIQTLLHLQEGNKKGSLNL